MPPAAAVLRVTTLTGREVARRMDGVAVAFPAATVGLCSGAGPGGLWPAARQRGRKGRGENDPSPRPAPARNPAYLPAMYDRSAR